METLTGKTRFRPMRKFFSQKILLVLEVEVHRKIITEGLAEEFDCWRDATVEDLFNELKLPDKINKFDR